VKSLSFGLLHYNISAKNQNQLLSDNCDTASDLRGKSAKRAGIQKAKTGILRFF
jgi:hypothetical protein